MDKLCSTGQAAKLLGVSASTLRRWECEKRLIPERTKGGQRQYRLSQFKMPNKSRAVSVRKTIAYARVSSRDQKTDLMRQQKVLEMYCAAQGWSYELISDLGSGMNYYKKRLKQLLNLLLEGKIKN